MKPTLRHIVIIGTGVEAWLPAAYLRMRLPHEEYSITLIDNNTKYEPQTDHIIARPNSKKMHQAMQLSENDIARYAEAKPLLCAEVETSFSDDPILFPFGRYGIDRDGAEFQHLWRRLHHGDRVCKLSDYNLAMALHKAELFIPKAPPNMPSFDYGYKLSEKGYLELLKKTAHTIKYIICDKVNPVIDHRRIASLQCDGQEIHADLYIDATCNNIVHTDLADDMFWHQNSLSITKGYDIMDHQTGMRLHRLQMAMERLIKLWPDSNFSDSEIGEYNRLSQAEYDHIEDMHILLSMGQETIHQRSALQRKISVFKARGRIAIEDYEIFTKPEWIAVLTAMDIQVQSYDRLADRIEIKALDQWINQMKDALAAFIQQGTINKNKVSKAVKS